MEEGKKEAGPVIGEYKDRPVIRIPIIENPSPENPWHWFTFGRSKAKAIVKFYDAIKSLRRRVRG